MFKVGQEVWVKSMGTRGKLLEQRGARWLVRVEAFTVECAETDLSTDKPKGVKKKKVVAVRKHHPALKPRKDKRSLESLDLHGLTVAEAIAQVEKRVSDAIIADCDRLQIVHGVGTGALLTAVHRYLSGLSVVARYKLDPLNPGVTFVYFDE